MKIANYKEAKTKEEKLKFINNFIEFFSKEYNFDDLEEFENIEHLDFEAERERIKTKASSLQFGNDVDVKALLNKDRYLFNYYVLFAVDGEYVFNEQVSWGRKINPKEKPFQLSSTNGIQVNRNYNKLIVFVDFFVEKEFQIFLYEKMLARFPAKGTTTKKLKI